MSRHLGSSAGIVFLLGALAVILAACGGGNSPEQTDATAGDGPVGDANHQTDGGLPRDGGDGGGDARTDDAGGPTVTFVVTVPAGTPRFDTVYVTGNVFVLGSWNPAGLALSRDADGRYRATQGFGPGEMLEFKLTRGSWETVEKASDGSEVANRTHQVTNSVTLEVEVARWADEPMVTGNVEDFGTFHSAFLVDRPVLVYLPPGYASDTTTRYPVLYLHDGQNLFDTRTAFGGVEWGVDETAEGLILAGQVAPVIIVAVGNTADRIDEYTPTYDSSVPGGGDADLYGRLLVEELKPAIDARYRTLTDAANTGLAGSSLGGLVSMYLGLKYPGTFTRLGVVSPSVWWDNLDIVTRVNALAAKPPLRIWEDIGTAEGSGTAVTNARALRDALVAKGWVLGSDLSYHEIAGAAHNEAAWAARVGDILKYLFPAI
jgi:predicted alpha/beta superfamily hydrolase